MRYLPIPLPAPPPKKTIWHPQGANVQTKDGSIFKWALAVPGGRGTSWEGLVYDLTVTFSRRHPFEPPRIDFPRTSRNVSNPTHPLIDGSGRLRMQRLSPDKWLPTIDVSVCSEAPLSGEVYSIARDMCNPVLVRGSALTMYGYIDALHFLKRLLSRNYFPRFCVVCFSRPFLSNER